MATLTKEEKNWRAESDANTLIEAEAISNDASRKRAALQKVKRIASDAKKRADAANKVAKTRSKSKTKRKSKK